MTRRLYWEDAYMKEFDATVRWAEGSSVLLDRTAFYPRGGGLVSDTGELAGVRVREVIEEGEDIVHHLEGEAPFKPGDRVRGRIDWERRYRVMRLHTAAHLLAAIINRRSKALVTGGNIEPDKARMDFALEEYDRERFLGYVEETNRIIRRGAEVRIYFLPREEAMKIPGVVKLAQAAPPRLQELRIVEIVGYDIQADGGVHVKDVKEVGGITVMKVESKGRNNRRVYFTLSD